MDSLTSSGSMDILADHPRIMDQGERREETTIDLELGYIWVVRSFTKRSSRACIVCGDLTLHRHDMLYSKLNRKAMRKATKKRVPVCDSCCNGRCVPERAIERTGDIVRYETVRLEEIERDHDQIG